MNKKRKIILTILYTHSYIFLFSLLTITTLCFVEPKFEACQPKTCGNNQSISYPFYIDGIQKPFCGYPGFALSCGSNGFPILNLSNTSYYVDEIFYDNRTLRVSNSMFSRSSISNNKECITLKQNLTLPNNNQFVLAPNQKGVTLFFGCNLSLGPTWLQEHRIGCYEENETSSVLALYKDDKNVSFVSRNCEGGVADLVVENGDGDEKGNIEEVLRKGFLLNWTASDCSLCRNTGGRCGFDSDIYIFRCYCADRIHAWKCDTLSATAEKVSRSKVKLAIGLSVGVLGILITGLLLFLILFKRKHATSGEDFHSRNSYSDSLSNLHLESGGVYFEVPIFSYKELKEATNNFDHTKELGDGGFGTVYHGKLKDGREVAVKRLYEHNYRRVEQFMNEVQILTRLRHTNLVSLYGCTSKHSHELLLVYEYISNGTVACHLHGGLAKPGLLPWSIRMKIAIETATALAYLHASHIIHRDVKTNNILLTKNFCVKVADFGLSRLFRTDVTHVSTAPQGTPGYVDPEYHQCYQLTSKSDVYSFGVVLIELISSKPAVDINRSREEINLSNLAIKKIQQSAISELVDPCLGFGTDNEVKRKIVSVAELAFQCLQSDKEFRPSMDEVLNELNKIETGKDEHEVVAEADAPIAGVSLGIIHTHSTSSDWDEVGLLKSIQQPSSPNTVTDKWESKCTTPNVSG